MAEDSSEEGIVIEPKPLGVTRSDPNPPCRSFVEAAWEKFSVDLAVDDCIGILVPKKRPGRVTDSGHLILPWRVHLTHCGISRAGGQQDLADMCSEVTELDLANNAITSLQELIQVISFMPKLTFLDLTRNPLHSSGIALAAHLAEPNTTLSTTNSPTVLPDKELHANTNKPGSAGKSPRQCKHHAEKPNSAGKSSRQGKNYARTSLCECKENMLPRPGPNPIPSSGNEKDKPGEFSKQDDDKKEISITTTMAIPATAAAHSSSPSPSPNNNPSCRSIRHLVLNSTRLEWQGVAGLLTLFPQLQELHLSLNDYTSVQLSPDLRYRPLRFLFFNNNPVQDWSHVVTLGRTFPCLQQLFLAETSVASLDSPAEIMAEAFPDLKLLSLNRTRLRGWEDVEKLRFLPSLVDVRLQGIPFLEQMQLSERRQHLLARLPAITHLNGSTFPPEERVDAERAFIRLYADSDEKPSRYYELEQLHGKLEPLPDISLAPQTTYRVWAVMDERREELEVQASQTVRELKKALETFAGLPPNDFVLYYHDTVKENWGVKLRFMEKKLHTLNVHDGDEFIVEPKQS